MKFKALISAWRDALGNFVFMEIKDMNNGKFMVYSTKFPRLYREETTIKELEQFFGTSLDGLELINVTLTVFPETT